MIYKMDKIILPHTKYVKLLSDLHIDYYLPKKIKNLNLRKDVYFPSADNRDKETTLIIAGDLWHAGAPFSFYNQSWFKEISNQYQQIIFVLGNHDFWKGNLSLEYEKFNIALKKQEIDNIYLLQENILYLNNIKIIGGTLWTDFLSGDKLARHFANITMNDYKFIKNDLDFKRLKYFMIEQAHHKTRSFIFQNAKKENINQKLWVISHHAPSEKSLNQKDPEYYVNGYYYSNLEKEILSSEIDLWMHGHVHSNSDYYIGKTKIISNPKGMKDENPSFTENYYINI